MCLPSRAIASVSPAASASHSAKASSIACHRSFPPDGVETVAGGAVEPRVLGDRLVVGGDAVRHRRDHRGDLQRGRMRVGARPERRAARRVRDGQRERQAAVRQRHRRQPVAERGGLRRGDGAEFREHLEGVQRGPGLARPRPQVGFQPVTVAAVGVAVGVQGGEQRVTVAAARQQLEPAAVERPRVHGHEVGCLAQIHGSSLAAESPPRLVPFGHHPVRIAPARPPENWSAGGDGPV